MLKYENEIVQCFKPLPTMCSNNCACVVDNVRQVTLCVHPSEAICKRFSVRLFALVFTLALSSANRIKIESGWVDRSV